MKIPGSLEVAEGAFLTEIRRMGHNTRSSGTPRARIDEDKTGWQDISRNTGTVVGDSSKCEIASLNRTAFLQLSQKYLAVKASTDFSALHVERTGIRGI